MMDETSFASATLDRLGPLQTTPMDQAPNANLECGLDNTQLQDQGRLAGPRQICIGIQRSTPFAGIDKNMLTRISTSSSSLAGRKYCSILLANILETRDKQSLILLKKRQMLIRCMPPYFLWNTVSAFRLWEMSSLGSRGRISLPINYPRRHTSSNLCLGSVSAALN